MPEVMPELTRKFAARRKFEAGFTLGELGLVLLIVAMISMFAYPKFIEYSESVTAGEEADNITHYVSKMRSAHATDSDFRLITTEILRSTGIFPGTMVQGTNVINKYQGTVTAEPGAIANPNDSVQFTSTNYSLAGCREVVPRMAGLARIVTVNGTPVKPKDEPLDRQLLGTACTVAANTIVFIVSK